MMRTCVLTLGLLAATSTFAAKNWDIYAYEVDGMTGPQQITNAMTQAGASDVLRVHPGVYDFTGTYMSIETYTKDSVTYTVTNHINWLQSVYIYGRTADNKNPGHWDDTVVFRGDGTGRCMILDEYWGRAVRNITFENFSAGSYPEGVVSDLHTKGCGGAIQCVRNNGAALAISNCVFRNCRAYNGGAVHGGGLTDCFFTNNVALGTGGAVSAPGGMNGCLFVDNYAKSVGALFMLGDNLMVTNCVFIGNSSHTNGNVCLSQSNNRVIDCVFSENHTEGRGGVIGTGNSDIPFVDCVFSNNWAKLDGGAIEGSSLGIYMTNCTFVGNHTSGGQGGAVHFGASAPVPVFHRCVFEGNWTTNEYKSKSTNHGGAIRSDYGLVASECTFTSNIAYCADGSAIWCCNAAEKTYRYGTVTDSTFTGNYASDGTVYCCNVSNCTFTGNTALMRGGAIYYGSAVDSRFYDNCKRDTFGFGGGMHNEYGGGCAAFATLTDCEITQGSLWGCSLTRCHIHDYVANKGQGCVFYEGNWATNCLIEHCSTDNDGLHYNYGTRYGANGAAGGSAFFVHCTFADNTYHKDAGFYHGKNATDKLSHPAVYEGCIFSGNKKANGTAADISGRYITDASKTHFRNCVYGTDDGTFRGTDDGLWSNDDNTTVGGVDPKFMAGNPRYPDVPYYALRYSSPAHGKGDVSLFAADDVDLAGNLRVRDNKLDLGCYQSWYNPVGFILMFR